MPPLDLSFTGGAAGPATSGASSTVSGITFGSINTGSGPTTGTWLVLAIAAVVIWYIYGRRK